MEKVGWRVFQRVASDTEGTPSRATPCIESSWLCGKLWHFFSTCYGTPSDFPTFFQGFLWQSSAAICELMLPAPFLSRELSTCWECHHRFRVSRDAIRFKMAMVQCHAVLSCSVVCTLEGLLCLALQTCGSFVFTSCWMRIPSAILLCCRWWVTHLQSWNFTWRSVTSRWRPDSTSLSSAHPSPRWSGTPSLSRLLPRRTSSVYTSEPQETGQRRYWRHLEQRDRLPVSSVACRGETTRSLL